MRSAGEVLAAAVFLMPIQHLKDAEAATAARERQLSLITNTIGFPVTYFDCDGVIRFANAHSAAWAGLRPEEMIGRPYQEIAPAEVVAHSLPLLRRAWAGEALTYERAALWPGRETRRIRGHMIPDKDETGTVRGALVVLMDIEEDHQLKESLLAKTREMRLVMDNVGVPMAYIDAERRFRFANAPGPDWPREINTTSVVGLTIDEVYPPEVLERVEPLVQRALSGEKVVYERLGLNGRGEQRWVRVKLMPDVVAWNAAERAWARGAVYAGCSPGAMILGKRIPSFRLMKTQEGFGIFPAEYIIPHFDAFPAVWRPLVFALQKQLKDGQRMIGIDKDTALVGALQGEWKVMGRSEVHIFTHDGKTSYRPGDIVPIVQEIV